MKDAVPQDINQRNRSRRLFDLLNRHRLKLALLIVGLALLILLADSVLKGSAF